MADQMFISIYYSVEDNCINVLTDMGRIMIPIINGEWNEKDNMIDMIKDGKMMWICAEMADNFIVNEYSLKDNKKGGTIIKFEAVSEI